MGLQDPGILWTLKEVGTMILRIVGILDLARWNRTFFAKVVDYTLNTDKGTKVRRVIV